MRSGVGDSWLVKISGEIIFLAFTALPDGDGSSSF